MNIKKAKEDIRHTVRAYLEKNEFGRYRIPMVRQRPILLIGPPGIGKTQIMEQVASECNIGLVAYTITHHTRQSAVGLPFIREQTFDGVTRSVTEYTMSEIIYSIYSYMEETGRREGILFIDEINCVSETLAPTMLQFLQKKTFGNQAVPEGWIIVAAGNPPEYNKSVREFDFVTLDRVRRIEVEPDLDVFKSYAREQQIHPFILSYLELRPQNFYKTENDVDGIAFVTARGWEDLSELVGTYESLGIAVDYDIIRQFLQHEEVARDVAAYYDLYNKYRDDYDINRVLSGQVSTAIYQRLFGASFDERLSCVELLVSGLSARIGEADRMDRLTTECFSFLKAYREELRGEKLKEPGREGHIYAGLLKDRRDQLANDRKTGLLSPRELNLRLAVIDRLEQWQPANESDPKEAFLSVKALFDQLAAQREQAVSQASEALENAFSFMEDAFGEGQEMVVFVTELTLNPVIARFISENGCERYYKYNKTLLIGSRRASILKELERDKIYSDPLSYDF